jgi:anti-anti-sigma factor
MAIQKWSEKIWVAQLGDGPALTEDLDQLLDATSQVTPLPDLVVDLSQLTHINSSNLSQLLRMRKRAVERDAKLRLATPQNSVWAVFLATGLDQVFEFRSDVSTALAELQMR